MPQSLYLPLSPRLFAWRKGLQPDGFLEIVEDDKWMRYFMDC